MSTRPSAVVHKETAPFFDPELKAAQNRVEVAILQILARGKDAPDSEVVAGLGKKFEKVTVNDFSPITQVVADITEAMTRKVQIAIAAEGKSAARS